MSNFFGKVVGRLVVSGATAAGRAFAKAYKQALANAKQGRAAGQSAAGAAASAFGAKAHLPLDEARAILNVGEHATAAEVEERFEKVFSSNDTEQGGSFYLQSKAFRAREALMEKLLREQAAAAAAGEEPPLEEEPKDARK